MWKTFKNWISDSIEIDNLTSEAWEAQKRNELASVESYLVDATLIKLRRDFNNMSAYVCAQLGKKARNGIFEITRFDIIRDVIGKQLDSGGV